MSSASDRVEGLASLQAHAARAGKTLERFIEEDVRAVLEKVWEIQQRTGKPVPIEQLHRELNP